MFSRFGLGFYDPAAGLDQISDEVNRLFVHMDPGEAVESLTVNIFANTQEAILTTEAPGVKLDDVQITLSEDSLTLRIVRPAEANQKGWRYHRRERQVGEFVRTIQLPFRVDSEKAEARLVKGLLLVRLPRAEEDKPRQIRVKSA